MVEELIKKLVESYGPSGFEEQLRALIQPELVSLADKQWVDAMGNLIALKKGTGGGRKIMVAAHMDEIGLMVSHITEDGFLRFTNIGGVFPHTLMGNRVQFANGTIGVIYCDKLERWSEIHPLNKYYIDVGASNPEESPVEVGDAASFLRPLFIQGNRLTAKSMDDRIGCAIIIEALKIVTDSPHDIYFVFSVQEEVGTRGAQVAANSIGPEVGIAVDITPAGDLPQAQFAPLALGKGPAIKVKDTGMIAHAGLVNLMKQRATEVGISFQLEVLDRGSTDARAMQITNNGVITGCISIPCRYAHSQSETVDLTDVESAVQLLVEILTKPIELR